MLPTYAKLQAALKQVMAEQTDVSMTCHGKEGSGNVFTRMHYASQNLVTKVLYRHDLSAGGKGNANVVQYINNFKLQQQQPWTPVHGDNPTPLHKLPEALQCEDPLFLTASREINRKVLETIDENGFTYAFYRRRIAQGKGIGVEIVVIVDTDQEFGVYEFSMNYYINPDMNRLREDLLAIHARNQAAKAS